MPALFQLAFVCSDLEMALSSFSLVPEEAFLTLDVGALGGTDDAPVKRIALGYLGPTNIEVIEVRTEVESIFRSALRSDGQPAFHHIGYLVDEQVGYDQLLAAAVGNGGLADSGCTAGFLSYMYLDRRADLGHYLEYVKLDEGGQQLFASVPRATLTLPSRA